MESRSKKQSESSKKSGEKKAYKAPQFIVYGSVSRMTMKRRRTSDGPGRRT